MVRLLPVELKIERHIRNSKDHKGNIYSHKHTEK